MPFSLVVTERSARVFGVNRIGLERRGFSSDTIGNLHKAFRVLTKAGLNTDQALEKIASEVDQEEHVAKLTEFIRTSARGIVK